MEAELATPDNSAVPQDTLLKVARALPSPCNLGFRVSLHPSLAFYWLGLGKCNPKFESHLRISNNTTEESDEQLNGNCDFSRAE